jgi:hypothetical protein
MSSALTNSVTPKAPCSKAGAAVDFPAPFGPARTTTFGRSSLKRNQFSSENHRRVLDGAITIVGREPVKLRIPDDGVNLPPLPGPVDDTEIAGVRFSSGR